MKSHRMLLRIACLVLTFCAAAWSQDTASVTGTITDPSGAAIPNAQVSVRNAEHGINRTTTSNGSGDFLFAALPIGSYDLTVQAEGFKKYEAKGIVLVIAQKARVNVTLEVGTISTEVVVQGSQVAQVETQSSDLGNTISGKEISQLELNGRDFTQLVTLSPGVTNQSGQDEGGEGATTVAFSINGGRTEYNNFEIDGGDALDNGSNTTLNVYPSIDAIAEVKVLTSNYGAQYGKNGSGTVEVETKSGTNHFHGDLYEFVRNDDFNATQFGLTAPPEYKKNDFGFTIGGPVYIPGHYNTGRQKTFFFWSEEWRRDLIPAGSFFSQTIVPTAADRTGDFSDQCTGANASLECPAVPGYLDSTGHTPNLNVVPAFATSSTISAALTALIPAANGVSSDGLQDQWYETPTLPTHWRQELFKIDHNINDKVRASFRYIHDSWNQQYPVPLWTSGITFPTIQTNFNNPGVSMVARLTANVSPTLLNEFVASYTTDHISTKLTGPWQRGNVPATLGLYNNGYGGKVPGISLSDGQYTFAEDPGYVPNGPINSNPTFTFRDNVTKIVGSHNVQFGMYFADAHKNEVPQPPIGPNGLLGFADSNNGSTVSSGNAYADLLLGNIASFTQQQAQLKLHNFYHIYEPYFQDDWHATRRLTLNLGLRISFYGTYREENNLAYNFDPNLYVAGASGVDPATGLVTGNPYNGWVDCGVTPRVPAGCMSNHWFNPAPRIGFAFDPMGNGKWAIRGGYGIFFEHTNGNESNTDLLEPDNIKSQTTGVVNISGYANLNSGLLGSGTPPLTVTSIPSKATWPYVQQWHFDIQHDLGRGTVATLSYVGSTGVHLTRAYELNQIVPVANSQNPYGSGQVINGGPLAVNPPVANTVFDCSWGPGNDQPSVTLDAYGVPMNAVTSYGTPVPYTPGVGGGPPSGAAANLFVACGNNPNFFRPYPGWASIGRKDQTASSNYNGLQVSVRHNIGGLELSAAYTYSHSIDNSSSANDAGLINAYDLNAYRASSNFDQRHNINIAYVYDLPFFKGKGLTHKLLGGWQWSGITLIQSGSPFSVYNKAFSDNAGVGTGASQIGNISGLTGGSYPDLVGNPRAGVQNTPFTGYGPLLYNPAAFVAPRGLTFGDAGRNILNNPWRTNFDMALLKHFAVTETKYFEFRAEAFNVFNHTEFNWLGGDGGSASSNAGAGNTDSTVTCYGGANNSAGDPSCLPSLLFRPGAAHAPRILQLALKLIF